MEFRVLGPVEMIGRSGRLVRLPPRERVVLGMLLLYGRRRVVSVDKLIDAIWGDSPPATARQQISICISVLRKLLREECFEGELILRPPGYTLELGVADRFDLEEFAGCAERARQEIRNGRPLAAMEKLRRALALWRGNPLAGANSRMIENEVAHLTERMLTVAEMHADVRLRFRLDDGVVEDLLALIAAHPLRETLHARLMQALVQAGRNAEAIEAYQLAEWTFMREVGSNPGIELRRIREEIFKSQRLTHFERQ